MSDGFVYLILQKTLQINVGMFPLLFVGTALVYLLFAVPAGRTADRFGRVRVFIAGHALLAILYFVLMGFTGSEATKLVLSLMLLGSYYAMTDGVLMAIASAVLPDQLKTSGFAVLTTVTTLFRLFAATVFGALWNWLGTGMALLCFAICMLVALPIAHWMLSTGLRSSRERYV